jgi:hypothetical protein
MPSVRLFACEAMISALVGKIPPYRRNRRTEMPGKQSQQLFLAASCFAFVTIKANT